MLRVCGYLSVGEEATVKVRAKKTGKAPVPPYMRAGEPNLRGKWAGRGEQAQYGIWRM